MDVLALRLRPSQDLRQALASFATEKSLDAAWVMSGIGSLSHAAIRFANQPHPTHLEGPFEILSLNGTLSRQGVHLHLAIANSQGQVLGGHLCDGSIIYTTAEIVIGTSDRLVFRRQMDKQTGFRELEVGEMPAHRHVSSPQGFPPP